MNSDPEKFLTLPGQADRPYVELELGANRCWSLHVHGRELVCIFKVGEEIYYKTDRDAQRMDPWMEYGAGGLEFTLENERLYYRHKEPVNVLDGLMTSELRTLAAVLSEFGYLPVTNVQTQNRDALAVALVFLGASALLTGMHFKDEIVASVKQFVCDPVATQVERYKNGRPTGWQY